jgi:hypothetical protein
MKVQTLSTYERSWFPPSILFPFSSCAYPHDATCHIIRDIVNIINEITVSLSHIQRIQNGTETFDILIYARWVA